jgi:hypothetical protein
MNHSRIVILTITKRNKVNNLKKTAKEHFEQNLDTLILENISNPKTYWKIMKMLIKSNKGCSKRIRSRFLISLLCSLLNHGRWLLPGPLLIHDLSPGL